MPKIPRLPLVSDLESLDLLMFNEWRRLVIAFPKNLFLLFAGIVVLNVILSILGAGFFIGPGGLILALVLVLMTRRQRELQTKLGVDRKATWRLSRVESAISPYLVTIFKPRRPRRRVLAALILAVPAIAAFVQLESLVSYDSMKGTWRVSGNVAYPLIVLAVGLGLSLRSLYLLIIPARPNVQRCLSCGHEEKEFPNSCAECGQEFSVGRVRPGDRYDDRSDASADTVTEGVSLKKYVQFYKVLPKFVDCPNCDEELELDPNEREALKFDCPNCGEVADMSHLRRRSLGD